MIQKKPFRVTWTYALAFPTNVHSNQQIHIATWLVMGCGSSKSATVRSQTTRLVRRESVEENAIRYENQRELEDPLVTEQQSHDTNSDPSQTGLPGSDVAKWEVSKQAVDEACTLVQDHLPVKNEEEIQSASSKQHTTAKEKGTVCDKMGTSNLKLTEKDVTSAGAKTETTSLSSSSVVNDDTCQCVSLLENKNIVKGNSCGEDTNQSRNQNGLDMIPVNVAPNKEGGCTHRENSIVGECRDDQSSELPERRSVEENNESPQQETGTEENETMACNSADERVTSSAGHRKDINSGTVAVSTDTDEDSEEVQYVEETPVRKPRHLQYRAFVSPKIRQLQEVLGFVSQNGTAMGENSNQEAITPLNPFDKKAAEDTRKLGLLKSPIKESHLPAFHIG